MKRILILIVLLIATTAGSYAQKQKLNVIAYFMGGPEKVDSVAPEKLSHIIFSFCHLKGNRLTVDNSRDSITLKKLVALKKKNPALKVILSLGGWGGCAPCSDVFSTAAGRAEFAASVLKLNQYFKSDGIDLDWEYPAIEGHPGHVYKLEDKKNFTELIKVLRKTLGQKYEISFAAGGFQKFLDESVEWNVIMPLVDRVNLMTYDLINGYSVITGHHTALYSTPVQHESTDNAVQYLIKLGVPADKLVIGAAFYARVWENVEATHHGVNQSGKFLKGIDFREFPQQLTGQQGFIRYWDNVAKAPYSYNAAKKLFATYDDKESLKLKTEYAIKYKLDGIMFWELTLDAPANGLLDAIIAAKGEN
jgi:chitinase